MTTKEWNSLKEGSIVSNHKGKNQRVVIKWNPRSRCIKLPSGRTKRGHTTYCSGDHGMFELVKVGIKNCKKK